MKISQVVRISKFSLRSHRHQPRTRQGHRGPLKTSFVHKIRKMFTDYPVLSNAITYGTLCVGAEAAQQVRYPFIECQRQILETRFTSKLSDGFTFSFVSFTTTDVEKQKGGYSSRKFTQRQDL